MFCKELYSVSSLSYFSLMSLDVMSWPHLSVCIIICTKLISGWVCVLLGPSMLDWRRGCRVTVFSYFRRGGCIIWCVSLPYFASVSTNCECKVSRYVNNDNTIKLFIMRKRWRCSAQPVSNDFDYTTRFPTMQTCQVAWLLSSVGSYVQVVEPCMC